MSDYVMLPDQVKIENALRAVLDDLTDDVDSPARADSLLIDVFANEDAHSSCSACMSRSSTPTTTNR